MNRVSPYVRTILVVFAMFATWQVAWLVAAGNEIRALLPTPFTSVTGWTLAWAVVAALSAVGSVSGRDLWARCAFASTAVVCVMGAVTILTDGVSMSTQFWRFGMAVTLAASCLAMMLSPLRVPPRHEGFPDGR